MMNLKPFPMILSLTQKKYSEQSRPFWGTRAPSLVDELLNGGMIEPIDRFFAQTVDESLGIQTSWLLWIFLLKASKEGHVGIRVEPSFLPDFSFFFQSEQEEMDSVKSDQIKESLQQDYELLIASKSLDSEWIILKSNLLYLKVNFQAEEELWQLVNQWEQTPPKELLASMDLDSDLTEEQKTAITQSLSHSLSIITGGPGVGKTFTANRLVEAFLKQQSRARIALMAPTGKAAAHLGSAFSNLDNRGIDVLTLHKLLIKRVPSCLPYDLILLDESSMVDLFRMRELFKILKPGSRCVLLGDPHQLPPIETGFIFADLVEKMKAVSSLTQCLRVEKKELIEIARAVRRGDVQALISYAESKNELRPLEVLQKEKTYAQLCKQIEAYWDFNSPSQLLASLSKYMILSPLKRGPFGIEGLNEYFKTFFKRNRFVPILMTSNHSELELYNGDIGVLVDSKEAIFPLRYQGQTYQQPNRKERKIPAVLLPPFDYAYCLSIHKSQGSEYGRVSIVLPPGSERFGRKLLYTGLTRAKKSFEIYEDRPTLEKILKLNTQRISSVQSQQLDHEQIRC